MKPALGVGGCDEGGNIVILPGYPDPHDHRFGDIPFGCTITEEGELDCPAGCVIDELGQMTCPTRSNFITLENQQAWTVR